MREIFIDVVNGSDSTIKVTQNDNLTGSYKLIITENGRRLDLTDKNIKFAFVKSDSHLGDIIEDLRVSNPIQGEIDFPITNRITKVDGLYSCGIAIYNSTGYLEHTGTFNLYVRENIFEKVSGELLENSAYKELMSLLDKATNLNAGLNPLVTNGTALKTSLENDINKANNLKNDLEINTNRATAINDTLVKNTATAEEKNTTLNNSLNETKKYIENLDGSQNLPQMRDDITVLQNGLKSNQELAYEGTNLKCENTLDGRIEDIVLEGMTYQNLHKKQTYFFNSDSVNDGKFIKTESDNSVVINITKALTSWHYFLAGLIENNTLIKPNTKYTIVGDFKNVGSVVLQSGNGITSCSNVGCITNNKTVITTNEMVSTTGVGVYCTITDDAIGETYAKNVMILEGDYTNKYIPPYFEGIKSVAERETNLCERTELGGIKWAEGDDYDSQNYCRSSYIPVKKGVKYSYSPIGVISNINEGVGVYHYDENKVYKQEFNTTTANGWFIAKLTGFVRLENNVKDGQPIKLEELAKVKRQVNEGELLPYIPPNKNEISILSCGKNLFDINKVNIENSQIKNIQNGYELTSYSNSTYKKVKELFSFFEVGKTYTVSLDYDNNNGTDNNVSGSIGFYNATLGLLILKKGNKVQITEELLNRDVILYGSQTVKTTITNIQFVEGDKNSNYEPHKQDKRELKLPFSNGLKGLPNGAKDIIFNKNDGCYVKQKIERKILNQSFVIEEDAQNTDENSSLTKGFAFIIKGAYGGNPRPDEYYIADSFLNKNVFGLDEEGIYQGWGKILIRIKKDRLETQDVEGFKKWLSQNPITVYYELATPVETKISDTKLSLDTYNALTYVFSNNAISPNIKLKVASNLGSIIQQNARSINDIYKLIDEVLIPQIATNTADIAVLKLK